MKSVIWLFVFLSAGLLTGCFSSHKAKEPMVDAQSKKQNELEVETLLSQSVFLRPTLAGERSLYLKFTSTADKPVDLEGLQKELSERFRAKGYRLTTIEQANFIVQVNILSISKTSKSLTKEAISNGFGAAVAVANAAVGPAGQVVSTAAESATSIFFRETYFNMITDIMISERTQRINLLKPEQTAIDDWKEHKTRALSSAKDVNANQDECIDNLEENLLRVLNGLF
jgi:hypothetical protein